MVRYGTYLTGVAIMATMATQYCQAASFYSITDLGELSIPANSTDYQNLKITINDNNQIVGWERTSKSTAGAFVGFTWDAANGKTQPALTTNSHQFSQSNTGQISVGHVYTGSTSSATQWNTDFSQQTGLTDLGGNWSIANSINASQQIVGASKDSSGVQQAVVWNNNTVTNISNASPGNNHAASINVSGNVTGQIVAGTVYQAFRWNGGLTTLNQIAPEVTSSWGADINDNDQIVGGFNITAVNNSYPGFSFSNNAYIWDPVDGFIDLSISQDYVTWGTAINNDGLVVGGGLINNTTNFNDARKALLWENNVAYELNTLLTDDTGSWKLQDATDINNSGYIVGIGKLNNVFHAFLLTPEASIPASADLSLNAIILNTPKGKPQKRSINVDATQKLALQIKNNGPDDASNISLTLNSKIVSVIDHISSDKGTCQINSSDNIANCSIDSLVKDEVISLVIEVNNQSDQSFDVEAVVSADQVDPQTSTNNVFNETVTIQAAQIIIEPKPVAETDKQNPDTGTPNDNSSPSDSGATNDSSGKSASSGSGCSIGKPGTVDPLLLILVLLSFFYIIRQKQQP